MSFAVVLASHNRIACGSDSRTWDVMRDIPGADHACKIATDGTFVFAMTGAPEVFTAWQATPAKPDETAPDRAQRVLARVERTAPLDIDRDFVFGVLKFDGAASEMRFVKGCIRAYTSSITIQQDVQNPLLTLPFVTGLGADEVGAAKDAWLGEAYRQLHQQPDEDGIVDQVRAIMTKAAAASPKIGGPLHISVTDGDGSRWLQGGPQ
jgi:hypothetical protein